MIRTRDPSVPNAVLYQAELHSDRGADPIGGQAWGGKPGAGPRPLFRTRFRASRGNPAGVGLGKELAGSAAGRRRSSEGTLDAEVDQVEERVTSGRVGEGGQGGACLVAELCRPRQRALDGMVPGDEPLRMLQILGALLLLLERAAPEAPLLGAAAREGDDDGQRDLAFPEIVADGLAQQRLPGRIVEGIVDELEGDAEIVAVDGEGLRLATRAGSATTAPISQAASKRAAVLAAMTRDRPPRWCRCRSP